MARVAPQAPARPQGGGERELYTEERILWMAERKPVPATDQVVETGVLDAI